MTASSSASVTSEQLDLLFDEDWLPLERLFDLLLEFSTVTVSSAARSSDETEDGFELESLWKGFFGVLDSSTSEDSCSKFLKLLLGAAMGEKEFSTEANNDLTASTAEGLLTASASMKTFSFPSPSTTSTLLSGTSKVLSASSFDTITVELTTSVTI